MSEDRWVRIVDPRHVYRAATDEVWRPVHYPQRWSPVVGLDRQTCVLHQLYKVRCRLRDVPPGTKIVDPGPHHELVEPWETEPTGDEEYWDHCKFEWLRRTCPSSKLTPTNIYRRPIAKPVSKTTQPGGWWFNEDGERVFISGLVHKGRMLVEYADRYILTDGNWQGWHHEPACTGWDWQPPQPEPLTLEQRLESLEQRVRKLEGSHE